LASNRFGSHINWSGEPALRTLVPSTRSSSELRTVTTSVTTRLTWPPFALIASARESVASRVFSNDSCRLALTVAVDVLATPVVAAVYEST
jgi:hypothetical protein